MFEAEVYREPDGGKYIVNGDTPIGDRKHLQEFFENNVQKSVPIERGLIVQNDGGVDAAWSDTEKMQFDLLCQHGVWHDASQRGSGRDD